MRMWIGVVSVLLLLFSACKQDVERQRILKVYGADWSEDGRVMVLGRFTDVRVTYGWLWGASYDTLKNQDVMLWIDPVSRAVDSVWVIHEPGGVLPQSSDMWKDPLDQGWWIVLLDGEIRHYAPSFQEIIDQIYPCGNISFWQDTLYFACQEGRNIIFLRKPLRLPNAPPETLFIRRVVDLSTLKLLHGGPSGTVYFSWGYQLLRWEGGDSFTVIDSPAIYFGFKNDTLVVHKIIMDSIQAFIEFAQNFPVDTLHIEGIISSGAIGNCFSLWKWFNNMAVSCNEASVSFCIPKPGEQGVMQCDFQIQDPSGLLD